MLRKSCLAVFLAAALLSIGAREGAATIDSAKEALEKGDDRAAIKILKKSTSKNDAEAQWMLGNCYLLGTNGVSRDLNKAFKLFKKSANAGYVPSETSLGVCYLGGAGVQADINKALECFSLAASHGDEPAQKMLEKIKQASEEPTQKPPETGPGNGLPADFSPALFPESGKSSSKAPWTMENVSDSQDYAYTKENAVLLGGLKDFGGAAQMKYFQSLRGPHGEIITFKRIGTCCPFATSASIAGVGLLDIYEITYEGLEKPLIIFVNAYLKGPYSVPKGLAAGPY